MTISKVATRLETDPLIEIQGYLIEVEVDFEEIMAKPLGKIIEGDHKTITEMRSRRENNR